MMRFFSIKRLTLFLAIFFCFGVMVLEAADPVVVELHYQNGIKFYKRGLYERAIQEFEKTLSLDPGHTEAKDYLSKVKEAKDKQTRVEAKRSKTVELDSLYNEGKKRYASRDYQGAIEIFDDILKIKPIDDFASFYKERCEMFISGQLAKEKKIEDAKRMRAEAKEKKRKAIEAKEAKKAEKAEMLEKRRSINEERRKLKIEKIATAKEAAVEREIAGLKNVDELGSGFKDQAIADSVAKEPVKSDKELLREQRKLEKQEKIAKRKAQIQEKKEKRQQAVEEKKAAKEEKRAIVRAAKEEKISAARLLREEKIAAKDAAKLENKQSKKVKIEQVKSSPSVLENKALFLRGVEEYGHKDYEAAIATFKELIEIENSSRKLYTNSARRLIDKAKKKLEESKK